MGYLEFSWPLDQACLLRAGERSRKLSNTSGLLTQTLFPKMMRELSNLSTVKSTTRWLLKKKRRRWSHQRQSTISTMLVVSLRSYQLSLQHYSTSTSMDISNNNWKHKKRHSLKMILTLRIIILIMSHVSLCISMLSRLATMWPSFF